MNSTSNLSRLNFGRGVMHTTAADIECFCRGCKGHYSRIVPIDSFDKTSCRCGSTNLLIYSMAGEATAPLRAG